jgi:hypothetical protein
MADPKPPIIPEARFANVARVRHSPTEFYIEFGQIIHDQQGLASLVANLVMTPQHAKALQNALSDNIGKYEAAHGQIPLPPAPEKEPIQ